jgi:hypothetical protein
MHIWLLHNMWCSIQEATQTEDTDDIPVGVVEESDLIHFSRAQQTEAEEVAPSLSSDVSHTGQLWLL